MSTFARYLRVRSVRVRRPFRTEGSVAVVDSGSFRRAFSSFSSFSRLPSPFASQSEAPIGAPRQFGSTEHLSTEAIAAFVDGELRMSAHLRAAHHLSMCPECALEIDAQRQARSALRDSGGIRVPGSLLGLLSQIPHIPHEAVPPQPSSHDGDLPPALGDDAVRPDSRVRRKRR
ncbi:Anti-sigma-E factor RseA [Mycobacteroides salmoniphilum]|nr:Anti-sigma-E factor RseA [Mycobacteroides salmoniphilum]